MNSVLRRADFHFVLTHKLLKRMLILMEQYVRTYSVYFFLLLFLLLKATNDSSTMKNENCLNILMKIVSHHVSVVLLF